MDFWRFTHSKRYYLTYPWEWIGDAYRALKYAYQRAVRGWDDSIIWSIDYYLSTMMPIWLREIKKYKISTPILDDIHAMPYDPDNPDDEEYWNTAHKVWDTYLTLMIEGFESAKMLADSDLPIFKEAHAKQGVSRDNFEEDFRAYSNIVEELGGIERINAETTALGDSFDEGMKLFVKYYFSLWT
jgi:hypothetical protein